MTRLYRRMLCGIIIDMKVRGDFNSDFNNDFLISKDATMGRKEIAELIEKNVKGQYNQLDIAGTLPDILNALLGAVPMEVTNIEALTDEQLDSLNVGDAVAKVTGKQKHLYLVTYKGEGVGEGLVLTYNACGYGEAIAYDYTADGWVFNSKEVKTYGD